MRFEPCAIIPALDAADSIVPILRSVKSHLPRIIVIDDGSRDATAARAREEGAHVVSHSTNLGKGAALASGLREAQRLGCSHAVTLDADGQHDADEIPKLLVAGRDEPHALVIGRRDFTGTNAPGGSRFGRRFSNFWVTLETKLRVDDTQSGYRLYPVELVLQLDLSPSRFQWEVEVIVRAAWAGLPVREVDVSVYYPPPEERISHFRPFWDSMLITLLHFRLLGRWVLGPIWRHRRLLPPRSA